MKPVDGESDEQRVVGAEQDEVGGGENRLHAGLVSGVIVLAAILGAMASSPLASASPPFSRSMLSLSPFG